ncbi:hypothetical protein [Paenibacillus tarimensis]|uniref:hypothetical protein n=1 Tax=Paenibacillus tarimensis TaxID=416012 RepID=UPI001F23A102|nr:hypothetical protein [Paenibacillus tarimensis]MCF2942750.1 hypothetical protein [Paenibacillus tarimensis]
MVNEYIHDLKGNSPCSQGKNLVPRISIIAELAFRGYIVNPAVIHLTCDDSKIGLVLQPGVNNWDAMISDFVESKRMNMGLVPLETSLWPLRNDMSLGLWASYGTFRGDNGRADAANTPWAWSFTPSGSPDGYFCANNSEFISKKSYGIAIRGYNFKKADVLLCYNGSIRL